MFEDNTFKNIKIIDFGYATKIKKSNKLKTKRIGPVNFFLISLKI